MLTIIMEIPLAVGRATKYLQCRKIINLCHKQTRYPLINHGWYVCYILSVNALKITKNKTGIQSFTKEYRIMLLNHMDHIYHQSMVSKLIYCKGILSPWIPINMPFLLQHALGVLYQQLIWKGYCVWNEKEECWINSI